MLEMPEKCFRSETCHLAQPAAEGDACDSGCERSVHREEERGVGSRVFYGQGNDFNNLSGEDAGALGFLDAILSSL